MIISLSANGIAMTVYPVFADRLVARAFSINSCVFSFCSPGDHVLSALHTAETALQAFLNYCPEAFYTFKKMSTIPGSAVCLLFKLTAYRRCHCMLCKTIQHLGRGFEKGF